MMDCPDTSPSITPTTVSATLMEPELTSLIASDEGVHLFRSDSLVKCRICFLSQEDHEMLGVPLISPCACQGSAVHERCLKKWLTVRKRRRSNVPSGTCELCRAKYRVKRQFRSVSELKCIPVRPCDLLLQLLFFIFMASFIASISLTIHLFHSGPVRRNVYLFSTTKRLSDHELFTLVSGTMAVIFFFLALVVEMRASESLLELWRRFVRLNTDVQYLNFVAIPV